MIKKTVIICIILLILLSATVFFMARKANTELQEIVTSQFNTQQLLLARNIAQDIERHFDFLETALVTFANRDEQDPSYMAGHSYQLLKDWQVVLAGVFASQGDPEPVYSVHDPDLPGDVLLDFPWDDFADYYSRNPSGMYYSQTFKPSSGPFADTFIQILAVKTGWHPAIADDKDLSFNPEVAFFAVDAMELARRYAHGVVSGQTGYPWVIDSRGYFMYHVEQDFLGKDSFSVRRERNPDTSYQRINQLCAEMLLKGKEGTDWYISGWHREVKTEMKKLFAYSPAAFLPYDHRIGGPGVWSVGLAVPEREVSGLIQPVIIRQWVVVGIFVFFIVIALMTLYIVSLHWNRDLTRTVEDKTRHLLKSQKRLRQEKEKAEQRLEALVEAQQKLVHSEKFTAIGEAASHLAHEIKNPLMLISGFALQVMRDLPKDDRNREKLNIISDEAKRLEKMLNQVRDFTRPQMPKKEKGRINSLIQETLELVSEDLDMAGIIVDLDLQQDLPEVEFDHSQMKQVLINLIKNAREALLGGGRISISTGVKNGWIMVAVKDNGVGITRDKQEKIFSPFFTTKDKGTGLGLAVTFKILEDHNGEITVESKLGKGSAFIFYLPLYS